MWPVYVVDLPADLEFRVSCEEAVRYEEPSIGDFDRKYTASFVQRRIYQSKFREHVLTSYEYACAMCGLSFVEC